MQVSSIAEQLFFTTVRIDTFGPNGERGAGSGFYFGYNLDNNQVVLFCVTNKHVVHGMNSGQLSFAIEKDGKPLNEGGFTLGIKPEDWASMWFGHPDPDVDIAICAMIPLINFVKEHHKTDLFLRPIDMTMIPTPKQIAELDAIETVTFIGYPNGLWDKKNLLPIARRGTTASPIEVDFEGTPRFLIDASVFGGSSGSPVFIFDKGSFSPKNGGLAIGTRIYFVGVVAAVFFRTIHNEVIPAPIPTHSQSVVRQQEMIDLGIVFKARTVIEAAEAFIREKGLDKPTPPANSHNG